MSFNPQTPQSPSQFSPKSIDPLASMNSSMTSITTLPTPAHSVNGSTQPGDISHDTTMTDGDSPHNKRKRSADDVGDREHKKVHLEDPRRLGIENLHLDVGEKYLLCRTRKTPLHVMDVLVSCPLTPTRPNWRKPAIRCYCMTGMLWLTHLTAL
jgi:hypothetical protein